MRKMEYSSICFLGILCLDAEICPLTSQKWKDQLKCPPLSSALQSDLAVWPSRSVNFSDVLSYAQGKWGSQPGAYSFCHYVLRNNEIWRKCYGKHVGFNMFSDSALLSLARKVALPNTQFLMNLGDWPLESRAATDSPVPVISWCGSDNTRDIIFPTYELMEATLQMMGRQTLDIHSIQRNSQPSWEYKEKKGFFRGRDSRQERLDLVLMARKHPDLLEAGITRFFFFRDDISLYGPEVPQISLPDFFKFAYQINVDGTVAAYRLAYLLAGGSLVLKQDSPYYEHFYRDLQPWIHYVPIRRDLADLPEKIKWARENEKKVLEIVKNARTFVDENLQPHNIFCEHLLVLEQYSKILTEGPVEPEEVMERVAQPSSSTNCPCNNDPIDYHGKTEL